jgi:DNA-binding transcriptional LysR family regulator
MQPSLPSHQLDAFVAVARERHFSRAARALGLTQSALSLRIRNLEDAVGTTLFLRDRAGVRLTATGESLLRYCRMKDELEAEALAQLRPGNAQELSGVIRLGGFSSVMRSVVLPALQPLFTRHRKIALSLLSRELDELPDALRRGEIDYLILDRELESEGIEAVSLGYEDNVLVTDRARTAPEDVYLDHDERDQVTTRYLRLQGRRGTRVRRQFLDEVYAIMDGVRLGLGQAVLPRHLIADEPGLFEVRGLKPLRLPVILHHYRQPYYTRLHSAVVDALRAGAARILC